MKICEACGAEYEGVGQRYCSQKCANKHRRILEREALGKEYTVWSCGGGVQSTALAALFFNGTLPKPDYSVMVDTGYEKARVMEYVRGTLVPELAKVGITLEIVQTRDYYPQQSIVDSGGFCVIPAFRLDEHGKPMRMKTCCNETWKVKVIRKWLQSRGVEKYEYIIGISADEAHRRREPARAYYKNTYPLVDMGLDRQGCLDVIKSVGWPEPVRSSCIMCGQQSDGEFWAMKYKSPEDFARVVEIEREIQKTQGDVFIHRLCKPIDKIFS